MSGLTPAAALAWRIAAAEAGSAGHDRIERGHLLVGILSLEKLAVAPAGLQVPAEVLVSVEAEQRLLADLLARAGAGATDLRRRLREALGQGRGAPPRGPISRAPGCKAAFARAGDLAAGHDASALDLLAALAEEPDGVLTRVLASLRLSPHALHRQALAFSEGVETRKGEGRAAGEGERPSATPELDRFGRDLTRLAREGRLHPVIGRRSELLQVLQTLARSTKNNPVLVGEAGVGKTAIVEGLALRAVGGQDGAVLGGRRIVELTMGALLGGTRYRGEFEKRLTALLAELRAHPEVVVFIDEIHTLVGAGATGEGALDAGEILKPALARGELRCIGATTPAEYARFVESDAALERRFDRIDVRESTPADTLEILRGLRPVWERHHGVRLTEEALQAAVDLSARFDTAHHLPDKAVDLVDKAAARARIPMLSMAAPRPGDPGPPPAATEVDARTVAEVLADKLGLPLELLTDGLAGDRRPRLLGLEAFLRARIVGQDEAIGRVAQRLRLAHAALTPRRGPLAVLLFAGPSGVGKTETARLLAEFLSGSASDLVRIDMSEYMEEHSVARLVGAPPGYVGYQEEGQLTARLRARPYSVVLLDEVEKAHPRVLDLFLQVFDAGRLTDGQGRTADARHAVFVLTSNLGGAVAAARLGFAAGPEPAPAPTLPDELARAFRRELLARIDEVILFRALEERDVAGVVRPLVEALRSSVAERHGVALRFEPEAERFLVESSFSRTHGVREARRVFERLVEAPLAGLVLAGTLGRRRSWRFVYDEGGLYLLPDAGQGGPATPPPGS